MSVKVIGLGGIGSHLVSPLCRYLDNTDDEASANSVAVIDGDHYEAKNANRQDFLDIGNKAEMTAVRLKRDYPDLDVRAIPKYVSEENAFVVINSGDVVFLCVDNHATRKVVSDHCRTLDDIVLISGGNELVDGNVQIYLRQKGRNLTPPLTHLHPEIEHPEDRNPAELTCEELAQSSVPQILFINLMVAACMLTAFWRVSEYLAGKCGVLLYSEQYFDGISGKMETYLRRSTNTER